MLALVGAGAWRRWRPRRLEVTGGSMRPCLQPGDRLLVLAGRRPRVGELVVVRDPRQADRRIVKRVAGVRADGLDVRGDATAQSTDSRTFGLVSWDLVEGRPVYRYAPPERAGRLARGR